MRKTSNANARARRVLHTDRARTKALVEEALAWKAFVRGRTKLSEAALERKALESLAFTLQVGANNFALPSKLMGTRDRQPAIGRLLNVDARFGTQFDTFVRGNDLVVVYRDIELGLVQSKHAGWLKPLLTCGAGVHLTQITGLNARGFVGVNVAFSRVGLAALRAERVLCSMAIEHAPDASNDGASGDGQAGSLPASAPSEAAAPPVMHLALSRRDVRLWRAADGTAHLSVPHVCLHSPTGPEWGYVGSGPKDAALSVLCAFTEVARAEQLAHDFCVEVIARIPREGGVIPAVSIAQWIRSQPG